MAVDISGLNIPVWVEQIQYWRTHLDVFIVQIMKVNLKPIQRVIARRIGNAIDSDIVQSRGFGKTWLIAMCSIALCILYPGTAVGVVSKTARQATLVLQKIEKFLLDKPAVTRELIANKSGKLVKIEADYAVAKLRGGSYIEARSVVSIVGQRYKIIIGDEKPLVNQLVFNEAVSPTRNEKRQLNT